MQTGHFEVVVDPYRLAWDRGRPDDDIYDRQRPDATLFDQLVLSPHEMRLVDKADLGKVEVAVGVLSVGRATGGGPFLVIEHSHVLPWTEDELRLDALLVPETQVLFVGAHETVVAYDLRQPARLWRDTADTGFHAWYQHGQVVLMAAELELAAWDVQGVKLWSTFVEPPYAYAVVDDTVHLTVMGVPLSFPLARGPSWGSILPWVKKG